MLSDVTVTAIIITTFNQGIQKRLIFAYYESHFGTHNSYENIDSLSESTMKRLCLIRILTQIKFLLFFFTQLYVCQMFSLFTELFSTILSNDEARRQIHNNESVTFRGRNRKWKFLWTLNFVRNTMWQVITSALWTMENHFACKVYGWQWLWVL